MCQYKSLCNLSNKSHSNNCDMTHHAHKRLRTCFCMYLHS